MWSAQCVDSWSPTSQCMNLDGDSFFSYHKDTAPAAVMDNDGTILWLTCMEIEEQSLTLVLAEEEEGVREQHKHLSASGTATDWQSFTALHPFTSLPLGKCCFAQQTNDGPWLVIAHSCLLKHSIYI